tara:strand:- start:81 stop:482 length:402 start_codon:yes stop_codon:yes gene_type:complete
MTSNNLTNKNLEVIKEIDNELSKRFINLDPLGYFLIIVDNNKREIIVEHFSNDLDSSGKAVDPETGEPIPCKGSKERKPLGVYRGQTAKEVGIKLTESKEPLPISRLDHALYLGRELQRAETCLSRGENYIQD